MRPNEILKPQNAYGLNSIIMFFGLGCVSIMYPVLLRAIEEWAFLVFAGLSFLGAIYSFVFVPETKNQSSEQIMKRMSVKMERRRSSILQARKSVIELFKEN